MASAESRTVEANERVAEVKERMDFTERFLACSRDRDLLGRREGRVELVGYWRANSGVPRLQLISTPLD